MYSVTEVEMFFIIGKLPIPLPYSNRHTSLWNVVQQYLHSLMYGQSVKQILFFSFFLFLCICWACVFYMVRQILLHNGWTIRKEKNKNLLLIQGAATNLQQLFMVCTTPSCISPKNVLVSLKANCCCHLYMSNLLIFQVLQELKSK